MTKNQSDWLDSIKFYFKRYPPIYKFLMDVISPVFSFKKKSYKKLIPHLDIKKDAILNIGSGPFQLEPEFINVDLFNYGNVNIKADALRLPFKNNSVDAITNIAILEHVSEPEKIMAEMYRVLKKGGYIYTAIPFMQGYHASPHDYKRWTFSGVNYLHNKFTKIECGVGGGPTSSLVWVLTEWLAILLSFRSEKLYKILYFAFMIILWPIKFLDILLIAHPMAKNIASTFYYIGRKL